MLWIPPLPLPGTVRPHNAGRKPLGRSASLEAPQISLLPAFRHFPNDSGYASPGNLFEIPGHTHDDYRSGNPGYPNRSPSLLVAAVGAVPSACSAAAPRRRKQMEVLLVRTTLRPGPRSGDGGWNVGNRWPDFL